MRRETSPELQMEKLRQLVLGENNQLIRSTVEEDARELVGQVLTEALHDRQKADGSVSQVLTPLVEKSVEASVRARKEQFVGYLYPIVGSLVRRAVSAFLAGLMERTNELLESSFTFKGLKWRFKAWQAGVSYSQYVVSRTFLFRVEQVLLIHRETGLLLKSVVRDKTQATDGDMVSAMLTAINDFVADSFSTEATDAEQNLDEIKTEDFTLLIKQGPQAVLVAAVTGNAPSDLAEQLQLTLEELHRLFGKEFKNFSGDCEPFEISEPQLNACLLAQQKTQQESKKKFPWWALSLLVVGLVVGGYYKGKQWQLDYMAWQIQQLEVPQGVTLLKAERCNESICIELLRDPLAQPVALWLQPLGLALTHITLKEKSYRSYEQELQQKRLQLLAQDFPNLRYSESSQRFEGEVSASNYQQFIGRLSALVGQEEIQPLTRQLSIRSPSVSSEFVNEQRLRQLINLIEQTHIDFKTNESEITPDAQKLIEGLALEIGKLVQLSRQMEQKVQIIVMGASDSVGSDRYNLKLSRTRADAVISELIKLGVQPSVIRPVGLGVLDAGESSRRVVLSVIRLLQQQVGQE